MSRPSARRNLILLMAIAALAAAGCGPREREAASAAAATAGAGGRAGSQVVQRFSARVERRLESNYLLFLPASYDEEAERSWPLILHLHGGGGRGTDPERLRRYPLVQRVEREPDFPFAVVTPQCPPGRPGPLGDTWTEHAELVLAILDEVLAENRIDEDRVYLVGHSMGGYGAWYLAHRAPERFAAVAPMSGPGVPWWTYRIAEAGLPVWVFHGELD
jgi:predicted peptidase